MPKSEDIQKCIALLEELHHNTEALNELSEEQRIALLRAAGQFSRPTKFEILKRHRFLSKLHHKERLNQDRNVRATTGIREARKASVFEAPARIANPTSQDSTRELTKPQYCYVCKVPYTRIHSFYDSMCIDCGEFNYQKRFQSASLEGKVALITGSRLKIGYQASLMMLRAGARVIATTRFPVDAALRFSKEADFADWGHRLQIHGLDLRHTPSVEIFARYIEQNTYQTMLKAYLKLEKLARIKSKRTFTSYPNQIKTKSWQAGKTKVLPLACALQHNSLKSLIASIIL